MSTAVSLAVAAAPPTVATPYVRRAALRLPPIAATVPALVWWLVASTRETGGRGPWVVSVGALLTAVAVVGGRAPRRASLPVLAVAAWLSVAAVVVAAATPTGWAGVSCAASYVCAAWTAVAVVAAVRSARNSTTVIAAVTALAVLVEFAEAWLPWWGGENAALPMFGTFYWHDPFAAFMGAGALVGLGLWLQERRALAGCGLLAFALGCVGVVFSTSRAVEAALLLAVLLVAAGVVAVGRDREGRLALAGLVAAGVTLGVSGPPFFPHRTWFFSGTAARGATQSLGRNGGFRVDFWHEALTVFRGHPLTGGGYHSLAVLAFGHVPRAWPLSPLAHDGYLQALSDGGLLLGVPVLLATVGAGVVALRSIGRALLARDLRLETVIVPLTLLFLLGHSVIDFDWSYPTDMLLTAVLAGCVVGGSATPARDADADAAADAGAGADGAPRTRHGHLRVAAAAAGLVVLVLVAVEGRAGDIRLNLPVSVPATAVSGSGA